MFRKFKYNEMRIVEFTFSDLLEKSTWSIWSLSETAISK